MNTWLARAGEGWVRWWRTQWLTLAAPAQLAAPRPDTNSPQRQFLLALLPAVALEILMGQGVGPFDRGFELPPALGSVPEALFSLPGADLLVMGLLAVVSACVTWLFWRLLDRRARFGAMLRAQLYVYALLMPVVLLLMALRAGIIAAGLQEGPLGWAAPALAVVLVLGGLVWPVRIAPRAVEAPVWRFLVALILTAGAFLGLEALSPLPWPPKREFSIRSAAMEPTAVKGDQLAANLWVYHWREPRRGELLTYRVGGVGRLGRVIGLPGQTVALRDGQVTINGRPLSRQPFGPPGPVPNGGWPVLGQHFVETTADGRKYLTQNLDGFNMADTFEPQTVPAGHYFILGDNRDNAADSRFTPPEGPGFVPRADLVGPVFRRTFPLGRPLDSLTAPAPAPGRR